MIWARVLRAAFVAATISMFAQMPALAQSNPTYIKLGLAKGVLYKPDGGPAPHVGVLVIHRTTNFLSHPACTELSKRGFMVLCMNSRYDNNETLLRFETVALDVKAGIEFLKSQPGIGKIVLFGHSGGAGTVTFYQAVAENGVAYCQAPDRLTKCGDDLAGLPKADGIVLADGHPGEPVQILRGLNPSYVYDPKTGKTKVIQALDPFDPRNGFNPNGVSHYSEAFQKRYFAAQSKEMNALIAQAQAGLKRGKDGGLFEDDGMMVIRGAGNPKGSDSGRAYLFVMDPDIAKIGTGTKPEKLLRNDGSIVTQIVKSVKAPMPGMAKDNRTFDAGTRLYTWRSFLSSDAMRSTNSIDGIDFCSSNNSATCALRSIGAPLLIATMGAHDFVRDNEVMYDGAKSKDKDLIVIEGAIHDFLPCKPCEKTPGQYSNVRKNLFDYVAAWLNKRYS
ncbi:MAG TPA: hypothetical protein VL574_15585 [Stellaceae bacterium]|nr:hypothetical protein [Stellaceae bacterium]